MILLDSRMQQEQGFNVKLHKYNYFRPYLQICFSVRKITLALFGTVIVQLYITFHNIIIKRYSSVRSQITWGFFVKYFTAPFESILNA